jgi:hypothetical protein
MVLHIKDQGSFAITCYDDLGAADKTAVVCKRLRVYRKLGTRADYRTNPSATYRPWPESTAELYKLSDYSRTSSSNASEARRLWADRRKGYQNTTSG